MQLNIDFEGKKTERITIAASEDLKHNLSVLSNALNKPVATLAEEYVAECVGRDIGKLMLLQARGKVSFDMGKL